MSVMSKSGRFVVLHHEGVADPHFDLMFEKKEKPALVTFRSPSWPIQECIRIQKLPDHRLDYLNYEGPINDNRGHVRRVDFGIYRSVNIDHRRTALFVYSQAGQQDLVLREDRDDSNIWELEPGPEKAA